MSGLIDFVRLSLFECICVQETEESDDKNKWATASSIHGVSVGKSTRSDERPSLFQDCYTLSTGSVSNQSSTKAPALGNPFFLCVPEIPFIVR